VQAAIVKIAKRWSRDSPGCPDTRILTISTVAIFSLQAWFFSCRDSRDFIEHHPDIQVNVGRRRGSHADFHPAMGVDMAVRFGAGYVDRT